MDISRLPKKLYAIIDISTNELVSNITNPGHKFWEVKGYCKIALMKYKKKYDKHINKIKVYAEMTEQEFSKDLIPDPAFKTDPNDLRIIEIDLTIKDKFYSIDELTK